MYLDAEQEAMRERYKKNQRRLEQEQANEAAAVELALAASNNGKNRKKLREALAMPEPVVVLPEPERPVHVSMDTAQARFNERRKTPFLGSTPNKVLMSVFKDRSKQANTMQKKIALLADYAAIVIYLRDGKELKTARRSFDSVKNSRFKLEGSVCWVCGCPAEVRHHIIQLQHGGMVTVARNIKFLCNDCHKEVHPWLKVPLGPPVSAIALLNNRIELAAKIFRDAANGLFTNKAAIEDAAVEVLDNFFNVVNTLQDYKEL
jgi:hypothetical protein